MPTARFDIAEARTGSEATVRVRGEIDLAAEPQLLQAVYEAAGDRDATRLVVDLSEVSFFGSAGVRCLLVARDVATRSGLEFRIEHPSDRVREVLALTAVDHVLGVCGCADDHHLGRPPAG